MKYKVKLEKRGLLTIARVINISTNKLLNVFEDIDIKYVKETVIDYMSKIGHKYLVDFEFEKV